MYPKTYHAIMPHVRRVCEREDHPDNPMMEPFPNKEKVDEMVEDIYNEYKKEYRDETDQPLDELFRNGHGGIKDIITILLISELLGRRRHGRRRRRRRRRFFPIFGGFGGYGYY